MGLYQVPNDSMSPLLETGDVLLALRPPFGFSIPFLGQKLGGRPPTRNELVIIRREHGSAGVRRVIGLPGDRIILTNQHIYANPPEGFYTPERILIDVVVPPGSVFTTVDNLAATDEARKDGLIKLEQVEAGVQMILFSNAGDAAKPPARKENSPFFRVVH